VAILGLIVNPVAGMGGRVGLHGTDGTDLVAEALRRGAVPVATERAARCLARLARRGVVEVLTAPGPMGGDILPQQGLAARELDMGLGPVTTAADTQAAARLLVGSGAELVLFAGGDGTARDIVGAIGDALPVLGIPSGVKMRSGVFAVGPEAAAELAADFLTDPARQVGCAEVLDAPAPANPPSQAGRERARGESGLVSQLFGVAKVPLAAKSRLVGPKSSATAGSEAELAALAEAVAGELLPGVLYLFGPGTTTAKVLSSLGITGTLLGVDAVVDRELVGADLPEAEILALMGRYERAQLVLGVVGGQGFLLGRGNQELGPRVLSRLGNEDVMVIASSSKLLALPSPSLYVDLGEEAPEWLSGYHRVRVGPQRYMMMRIVAAS
jgi:predicted polyphosphate/ATP-dependent NAD kinase